jgi:hypothetical protein
MVVGSMLVGNVVGAERAGRWLLGLVGFPAVLLGRRSR